VNKKKSDLTLYWLLIDVSHLLGCVFSFQQCGGDNKNVDIKFSEHDTVL